MKGSHLYLAILDGDSRIPKVDLVRWGGVLAVNISGKNPEAKLLPCCNPIPAPDAKHVNYKALVIPQMCCFVALTLALHLN